jgi:hypothetical protein
VLAELGLYSVGLLAGLVLVYTLGLLIGLVWRRRGGGFSLQNITSIKNIKNIKNKLKINRQNLDGWLLVVLVCMTVGLFFWRTHETIVGEQDSGTYYDTGINIAQTGSIMIDDPLLPALGPNGPFTGKTLGKLQPQLLRGMPGEVGRYLFISHQRLSGYFVYNNEDGLQTGEVIPQSFHLYSTLIALGYSLFGLFGAFYVTPFLGVLAVFAVYLTTRRLFPAPRQRWIGLLAALLLALDPVQVWFARETLWETLGEFLVFMAIYAFTLYAKPYPLTAGEAEMPEQRDGGAARLGAFGTGLAFGLICLAHAQFIFMIAPLFPLFIYLRLTRRWSREVWWLALSFGLLLLHAIIHIRQFSIGYFEGAYNHIRIFFVDTIQYWGPLVVLGIITLVILDAMPQRILALERWVVARWKWVSLGVAAITVGYLVYSYFIRVYQLQLDWHESAPTHYFSLQSYIGAPTTAGKERNLLRLGWYLSPLGIGLVFLGMAGLCWKRLNLRSAMFLAVTCIVSLIFLDQSYTIEHFIYSMRRYMPVTFPAFSILMAYALLEVLPESGAWLVGRWQGLRRRRRSLVAAVAGSGGGSTAAAMQLPNVAFAIMPPSNPSQLEAFTPTSAPIASNLPEQVANTAMNWGLKVGRYLGWLGALALVVFFIFTGMTIYRLQEYDGVTHQLEDLAQKFGPRDIVIFSGDPSSDGKIAAPLNYVFDRQSFILSRAPVNDILGQLFTYWQGQGYHIKALLSSNGGRFAPDGFDLVHTGNFRLTLTQLQDSDKQKPKNIETNSLDYGVYDVQSHSGAVGTLGYGQTQPGSWTLHAGEEDYPGLIDGFYPAERQKPSDPANLVYRWTDGDPQHHPVLRIPCLSPNASNQLNNKLNNQLKLTLDSDLNPNLLNIKIYLSKQWYDDPTDPKSPLKQVAGTIQLQPGSGLKTYTVDIPSNLPYTDCENGSLILHLVMDNTGKAKTGFVPQEVNPSINDGRLLGYKFYEVALTSQP